jgi:hypothetical protein
MPKSAKSRRLSAARRAELERRLREIRDQESTIKERIYKLEASIAATPGLQSARRLQLWNTVPADEAGTPLRLRPRTRYQRQLASRGRSRQALTALFLTGIALLLGAWLSWQLKTHGLI